MAALCAATAIIAIVVPFAGALSLLGTVPMGLLAYRYRLRVLIAATVAAGLIAFLIAGLGGLMTVPDPNVLNGLHPRLGKLVEIGSMYTAVAGLLNVLAIYDAYEGPAYPDGEDLGVKPDAEPEFAAAPISSFPAMQPEARA